MTQADELAREIEQLKREVEANLAESQGASFGTTQNVELSDTASAAAPNLPLGSQAEAILQKTATGIGQAGTAAKEFTKPLLRRALASAAASPAKTAITAAEIGGGLYAPYASPAIVGAGETAKALLERRPLEESLGIGAKAAGVDLATLGGLKALAWAAKGGGALAANFSPEAASRLFNNMKLKDRLIPSKTWNNIGRAGNEALEDLRSSLGKAVGEVKQVFRDKNVRIETSDITAKALTGLGEISRKANTDVSGRTALNLIADVTTHPKLKEASPLDLLEAIDNSKIFTNMQNLQAEGKALSEGQRLALRLRGELSSKIDAAADPILATSGLRSAKDSYAMVKGLRHEPGIRRVLESGSGLLASIKSAVRSGNPEAFDSLIALDNMLPPDKRFFDLAIKALYSESLKSSSIFQTIAKEGAGRTAVLGNIVGNVGTQLGVPTAAGLYTGSLLRKQGE